MTIIEFDISLFEEKILICVSRSMDTLKKLFPADDLSYLCKTHQGLAFGAIHKDKKHRRVIWLRKWCIKTFLHEAYHTIADIMSYRDIKDFETGAYLLEFIYAETIKRRRMIAKRGSND